MEQKRNISINAFLYYQILIAYGCSIVDKKHTQITTDHKKLQSLNTLLIPL